MSRRTQLGAWQLHVPVATQEVNGSHFVTFITIETRHAAADGFPSNHKTLGTVLAIGLVTGAGLQQDHWWRILTEQPTEGGDQTEDNLFIKL